MNPRLILSSLVSLIIGGSIYLLFRDPSLIFFGWIDDLGLLSEVKSLQRSMNSIKSGLPNWVIFSLPDGLWLFSYVCFMLHLWRKSLRWSGLIWVCILPIFSLVFEVLQSVDESLGTFDWIDLLLYFCSSIIPFVVFSKSINFNTYSKLIT
ncbi:MAG: hypothetical protein COA38_19370 [Fluviicola sp.]|nr:MAG: hypothetical protein COA38_19370 [Fluviicola sp.]